MVLYQNLEYVLKVLNLKCDEFTNENVLNFNKKYFFWAQFFSTIYKIEGEENSNLYSYYISKFLNRNTLIETFCQENDTQIIIHGKSVYNDYEVVGFRFKSNKQKSLFILKFGDILQRCIK